MSADLNRWLALEHEAVWLYPVLGAKFPALADDARASLGAHRATRDALIARIREAGGEPVVTALSYRTPRLTSAKRARQAAVSVEQRITTACLALTPKAEAENRRLLINQVTKAATAATTWGAPPTPFPGFPNQILAT